MGFFTSNNMYSSKQVGYSRKGSQAMKNLLKDKEVAKILDKSSEQDEFFSQLKNKSAGGITKDEMREVLGHFRHGAGGDISSGEAQKLAERIIHTGKRYIFEKNNAKPQVSQNNNANSFRRSSYNSYHAQTQTTNQASKNNTPYLKSSLPSVNRRIGGISSGSVRRGLF